MTIDKEKLKPCPFCGGQVQLETVKSRAGTLYGVVCRNTGNRGCTFAMEQVPSRTAEAAIARWNMRKPMDELKAENDAAMREASSLAMAIWRTTYAETAPEFELFDKASSIIGQIDKMVAGIMQERDQLKVENDLLKSQIDGYKGYAGKVEKDVASLRGSCKSQGEEIRDLRRRTRTLMRGINWFTHNATVKDGVAPGWLAKLCAHSLVVAAGKGKTNAG